MSDKEVVEHVYGLGPPVSGGPVLTPMVPLPWPYRCARSGLFRSGLFERMTGVYLIQRFGPYIPLLFGIGALLFVVGLLVRIFAPNGLLRDLGSRPRHKPRDP